METINIIDFRIDIEKGTKKEIPNIKSITNILNSKGLTHKRFGLCAEPYDKYYEIYHTDENKVSSYKTPLNTIHVTVNEQNSTRKRKKYFRSIKINYIDDYYYLCCLAQSSFFKESSGAEHIVYKVKENEIPLAINEIFTNVED